MTSQARTLDIIYVGTIPGNGRNPDRAYYGFPVGPEKLHHADLYPEGKFNISTLEVGKRYVVQTNTMTCLAWSHKAQQFTYQNKYVWVRAIEVKPKVAVAARSTKQRKASEALAAMPFVDDGNLFSL